jgi:hypothetical protein
MKIIELLHTQIIHKIAFTETFSMRDENSESIFNALCDIIKREFAWIKVRKREMNRLLASILWLAISFPSRIIFFGFWYYFMFWDWYQFVIPSLYHISSTSKWYIIYLITYGIHLNFMMLLNSRLFQYRFPVWIRSLSSELLKIIHSFQIFLIYVIFISIFVIMKYCFEFFYLSFDA